MKHKICLILTVIIIMTFVYAADNSGANIPELYQGLYPIKYSENGDVVFVSKNASDWYNYSEGRWANAVTLDKQGQMNPSAATIDNITGYYVWIPRYAYLIRTGYNSSNTGRIDIRFLKGTTNSDINGNTYYTINDLDNESNKWEVMNTVTYVGDRQMEYLVHPAFYFEEELAGIWVGKYEANKTREREIEKLQTIPNGVLWQSIDISEAFDETRKMTSKSENYDKYNLYGLSEEVNTHLIKAREYGAVVYLANSIYEANNYYKVEEIDSDKEYIAGYLEGTTGMGYLEMLDEKYKDIYTKDAEDNVIDIKGSAFLETSDGTSTWNSETTVINTLESSAGLLIKENQYGTIASNGKETDVCFRVVITKGTNNNEIKNIYQKDNSYYWLMKNGDVWVMGENEDGQLGLSDISYKPIPIRVEKDKSGNIMLPIVQIVCIGENIYYIAEDGTKYLKGEIYTEELDLTQDTIVQIPNLKKEQLEEYEELGEIKSIYGNGESTVIEAKSGEIYVMGDNTNNKLGINGLINIEEPTKISMTGIKDVGIGRDFAVFFKADGSIVGYGDNSKNGNGLTDIVQIAVQKEKAYFMKENGEVIDNQQNRITTNAYKIVAGDNHLVVLAKDGTTEVYGQRNSNLTDVIDVFAGKNMTVYLKNDGTTHLMKDDILAQLDLKDIVYAELNGSRPYFLTYDRHLKYEHNTSVLVEGVALNNIREIKGDIVLTEKNNLYIFNKNMEYVRIRNGKLINESKMSDGQLLDYKIYGNSVQNGIPKPDNPLEIESLGERTKNLFDLSSHTKLIQTYDQKDVTSWLTIDGNVITNTHDLYNGGSVLTTINPYLLNSGTYVLSGKLRNSTGKICLGVVFDDNTMVRDMHINTVSSSEWTAFSYVFNINTPKIVKGIYLQNHGTRSISNIQFKDIMIEKNSTATEYEPYGYTIPIRASKVSDKNLFNLRRDLNSITAGGMTVTWDEKTGEITINGTNTTNSTINFHLTKNLDVTKYSRREFTISMNNEQINDKVTIQFQTSNGGMYYSLKCDEINKVGVSRNKTFETKGVYLRCLSGCSVSNFKIRPQIEYGNVATEYEPYIEPVISNIYLDEPLRKIGDVADYIDFENQKLVRNVYNIRVPVDILKNLVKDSTRGQRYWDKNPIYPRAREAGSNGKISTVGKECYRLAYAYNDSFHWYIHNNDGDSNILVLVSPDDNTTLGEYFNNLSLEQDLDFAYVMEEPIEETIEVPPILTREGYNVIEVNTSTQPSNMLVKYNYSGTILD